MIIYNRTEYSELTNSQYRKEKRRLQIELLKLQEWTIDSNQRIAILLEGRDAAGKGSTIQRFIENLMSKATKIVELGVPNKNKRRTGLKHGRKGYQKKEPLHFLIGAGILGRSFNLRWVIVQRISINIL